MTNKANSFMFYENFLNAINILPENERERACYEFCKYGITGELPKDSSLKMFCIGVSASVRKYQGRGGKREGAGRKPNKNNSLIENQNNQKNQNNQNNHNEQTETKTKTKTETYRGKKPTLDEVVQYCQERNNGVDANRWFDYYSANGWRVGRNPMKDWRATVRTWERKREEYNDGYGRN